MEFLSTIILVAVAVWAGWHIRGVVMMAALSENPERVIEILKKIKKINEHEEKGETYVDGTELSIERVGNTLYAYAKETGQFVAQGPDLNSLLDSAKSRFPESKFFGYIPKDDSAKELV